MPTECIPKLFDFEAVERRHVVAGFDGGDITSNADRRIQSRLLRLAEGGVSPTGAIEPRLHRGRYKVKRSLSPLV